MMGGRLTQRKDVYAWLDPRSGDPRYVGVSSNPVRRLGARLTTTNPRLRAWLDDLSTLGLKPHLIILQRSAPATAERRWILRLQRRGYDLLNVEKTTPLHETPQGYMYREGYAPRLIEVSA